MFKSHFGQLDVVVFLWFAFNSLKAKVANGRKWPLYTGISAID